MRTIAKNCRSCHKLLFVLSFHNGSRFCRRCERVRNKSNPVWRIRRKSSEKKRNKIVRHRRRERLMIQGMGLRRVDWQKILNHCGNICLGCHQFLKLTVDHVIPLSCGGRHDETNVQPLCWHCNTSKSTRNTDFRDSSWPYKKQEQPELTWRPRIGRPRKYATAEDSREAIRKYRKEYYVKNREKLAGYFRKYRDANPNYYADRYRRQKEKEAIESYAHLKIPVQS